MDLFQMITVFAPTGPPRFTLPFLVGLPRWFRKVQSHLDELRWVLVVLILSQKQPSGVRDWGLRVSDREPAESCVCCVECLMDRLVFTQRARPFSPVSPGSSLLRSITPWLFNTSPLLRFCVQLWLRQADNLSPVCFGKHRRCKQHFILLSPSSESFPDGENTAAPSHRQATVCSSKCLI